MKNITQQQTERYRETSSLTRPSASGSSSAHKDPQKEPENQNQEQEYRQEYKIQDITADTVWPRMPKRPQDSHKGTFGKLLCVAGSSRYRGAAALSAEGALRGGCGIVTLASVEPVFASVQARLPECILLSCTPDREGGISAENADMLLQELSQDYQALLMGPGMGNTADTKELVLRLAGSAECTVILDADALNAVADTGIPASPDAGVIITPHPGEMARLCGCSIAQVKADRERIALSFARQHNCIVVLKEHRTLIASPQGELWRNTTGNSGLARGGSGDILAGLMASFAATGMAPLDAAICAVWLHGAAAERCSRRISETVMLPHNIFADLGRIFLNHSYRTVIPPVLTASRGESASESGAIAEENVHIRAAVPGDAPELLRIYAPYVEQTAITFEYDVPSPGEFVRRISHTLNRYPYLVAERSGILLGYCYAFPFHERAAYDWAAEMTIYLAQDARGLGIGTALYRLMEQILQKMNITNLEACIAYSEKEDETLTNDSTRFHDALGYRMVGRFSQCGYKFGHWYDMIWMEKIIGRHRSPMPPVLGFNEVRDFFSL